MLRVQNHPHAVKLLDAFEDSKGYQLIMQMLTGGAHSVLLQQLHPQQQGDRNSTKGLPVAAAAARQHRAAAAAAARQCQA